MPLLVALHGGLGSGSQFEQNSGFDGLAEANTFIVVYPNGTPIRRAAPNRLVWNGGGCCSVAAQDQNNVNDVGFISSLITKLEGHYHIDKSRVFATGHSNGAILAERLACQLSTKVVAIGVQAGDLFVKRCSMAHPVAALEIHGTQDQNIPLDGGYGPRSLTQTNFPPPVNGLKTIADAGRVPVDPDDHVGLLQSRRALPGLAAVRPGHGGRVGDRHRCQPCVDGAPRISRHADADRPALHGLRFVGGRLVLRLRPSAPIRAIRETAASTAGRVRPICPGRGRTTESSPWMPP